MRSQESDDREGSIPAGGEGLGSEGNKRGIPAWVLGGKHAAPRLVPSDKYGSLKGTQAERRAAQSSLARAGRSAPVKAQQECVLYSPRPRGREMVPRGASPRPDRLHQPDPLKGEP